MFGAPLQAFGRFARLQQIQCWPSPTLFCHQTIAHNVTTLLLQSDDTLWYPITAITLTHASATLQIGAFTNAGVKPTRVLANVTDGLNYYFRLATVDGFTTIVVDETPTADPVDTITMQTFDGENFTLNLINDPKPTWQLVPI